MKSGEMNQQSLFRLSLFSCKFAAYLSCMQGFRHFLPSTFLFVLLNGLFYALRSQLVNYGFSFQVLLLGNGFLYLLSIISLVFQKKATIAASPQISIRYFYISFLIKLILVAIVALIYARIADKVNKRAVIACMIIYLGYTFLEISLLLKAGKQKNA